MTLVRILSLLAAIGVPIFGFGMDMKETDQDALCGGRPYARISVPDGASPYVELTADGVTGPFLLDYGATRSSLSAASFSGPDGSMRTATISLPGIEKADFHLARYYLLLQPGNGQLGVIGDDLLSQFTVQLTDNNAFLSAEACRPEALLARGLTPVAQSGFFSSDPSKVGARTPQCAGRLSAPGRRSRLGANRHWLRGFCLFPLDRHQPGFVRPSGRKRSEARSGQRYRHLDMRRSRALACLPDQRPPAQN